MKQPSGTSFLIFPLPISGPHRFPRHVNWFISTLASPSCSSLLPGSSVIIHLTYPAMVWGKSNPSRDFTWGSCPEKLMKNSSLQSNLAVCCSNRSPRGTASNKRPTEVKLKVWMTLSVRNAASALCCSHFRAGLFELPSDTSTKVCAEEIIALFYALIYSVQQSRKGI